MGWLLGGVLYSAVYVVVGASLHRHQDALFWFRLLALMCPPAIGVAVIVHRRRVWSGCQWLFWATIALGLVMSGIGVFGWTSAALLLSHDVSWLGWYAVFPLFGTVTPLFALLTQPHRGPRDQLAATTAVDIAGIAVMTGFLYSRLLLSGNVMTGDLPFSLLALFEFQQVVVFAGMGTAALLARNLSWGPTYRRLATGLLVNLVILSIGQVELWQGLYRAGFVYDIVWILPFAFYPWAAAAAPPSVSLPLEEQATAATPSRPWVVFGAVALIPVLDLALRPVLPLGPFAGYRDLFTVVTILSVLPLLLARLAVERDGARTAADKCRLLSAAVERAADLVLITDTTGRVEHANEAFCRALDYGRAEVEAMTMDDFFGDQSRPELPEVAATVGAGKVWRGTLVHRRRDATEFQAAAAIVPLVRGLRVTHFVAVERDMTQDLQLRNQLVHSERLAATGQLVSGVAHELNNPLQTIIGVTELMLHEETRDPVRTDLQRVRSHAERAARIVRNLLTFVHRSPVERQATDVNELVASTLALRAYELDARRIEIEERYADGMPAVAINRAEIQQLLLNLVLNAEDAMETANGRGHLVVRTSWVDSFVVVDVEDDGPGIPPSIAEKVFEPFFSTKEVGKGTGLGLSIALGIAEAHGGSLSVVQSDVGGHVRLTLPAMARATIPASASGREPTFRGTWFDLASGV